MIRFCALAAVVAVAGCSTTDAPNSPTSNTALSGDVDDPRLVEDIGDEPEADTAELDADSSEDVIHEWVGGCFTDYNDALFQGCEGDRIGTDHYWPHDLYIFDLSCESLCCNYGFVGCIRGRLQKVVAFEIHPCVEAEDSPLPDGFPCDQLWPHGAQLMCECTNDPDVAPAEFPGWEYSPATPRPAK